MTNLESLPKGCLL
jgi:hypothetical protein